MIKLKLHLRRVPPLEIEDENASFSESSTTTVEGPTKSPAGRPEESTIKRKVTFCLEPNADVKPNGMFKDECEALWFNRAEYKRFRIDTICLAKDICNSEQKNKSPYSYERVVARAYRACCDDHADESFDSILTPDERKHLVRWAEVAPGRLGLEKWIVKVLQQDRNLRRAQLAAIVMDLQQRGEKAEGIASKCALASRPSSLFARLTADAHASSVTREQFFSAS